VMWGLYSGRGKVLSLLEKKSRPDMGPKKPPIEWEPRFSSYGIFTGA